jgi:polyisoprenoid-binding protein YceI
MNRALRIVITTLVLVGLGIIVGPWVYINLIKDDAPEALSLDTSSDQTIPSGITEDSIDDVNGQWRVVPSTDSIVGYRVEEVLFGQNTEGVGRTKDVNATLIIENNTVTAGSFTVQMGTLMSDAANRDRQFNNRIMETAKYPTATFVLSSPITLPANSAVGAVVNATATGDLTLRNITKTVTFPLQAQVEGTRFNVVGNITIVFDEWGIPEPSIPGISVEPEGLLEFSLVFER